MREKDLDLVIFLGVLVLALGVGGYTAMSPRGIRNNNPGNIRRSADNWMGLADPQEDPAFFQFTHAKYGLRALARILNNYRSRYSLESIKGIIYRYAPPAENDSSSYANHVAGIVGISPDRMIYPDEWPLLLPRIMVGIIQHENGQQPYTMAQIREGIDLA